MPGLGKRIWGTPVVRGLHQQYRRRFTTPFLSSAGKPLLVHCCYHKVGTVWFMRILRAVAEDYAMEFYSGSQAKLPPSAGIFMQHHSDIDLAALPAFRGSHMIRDPRDVAISGYFYHLWTKEEWVHVPREEFGGKTYQQHLNSLDPVDGLMAEITYRTAPMVSRMAAWDYNDPRFVELRYEDVIADERAQFVRMFKHYGFNRRSVERALHFVEKFSFSRQAGRSVGQAAEKSHLRSGRPGEWRDQFTEAHKDAFKRLCPGALTALGYETSDDW